MHLPPVHATSKTSVDRVLYAFSIITILMTIPQVLSVWMNRSAEGVSIITWGTYLVSACVWLVHGASIVVTADQVDIDAGHFMKSRARGADVKSFAELMITDHTAVNHAATELVTKLKVTPEDNPTSQSLKAGGEKNLSALEALHRGAARDKAYVDHEVAYHEQVIDALDKVLIPGATNPELKALLVKVRPAFAAHLEHARALQSAMARRSS